MGITKMLGVRRHRNPQAALGVARQNSRKARTGWLAVLPLTLLLSSLLWAAVGDISTVAGTGTDGYDADGGAATTARLNYPQSVVLDSSGNLYIGDTFNNRIRKVDTHGNISTVAGTGIEGYDGDGGAATVAKLNRPRGIVLDSRGNLYIVDGYNHCIRKVDAHGIISTVAGTGTAGYNGDGGLAKVAKLNSPINIALDSSGNLYIADYENHRIRKVDTHGIISTVAGTGGQDYSGDGGTAIAAKLNRPTGIVLDSSGNLYIADSYNERIRKVDAHGIISTVAGTGEQGYSGDGGAAITAKLTRPRTITLDSGNNLYIAEPSNHCIRKVGTDGIISTVAGTGTGGYNGDSGAATAAKLNGPMGVALDSGSNLFISDTSNNRIRKVISPNPIQVTTQIPVNGATGVVINTSSINLTFNEAITVGTGDIIVHKASDNSAVDSIDVATSGVTINGQTATISLLADVLTPDTSYYVIVPAGAFRSTAGGTFSGLITPAAWGFTTAATTQDNTGNGNASDSSSVGGSFSNGGGGSFGWAELLFAVSVLGAALRRRLAFGN